MLQKFIILTLQRTGSTYLSSNLNNHPNIRMHGEIFLRDTLPSKDGYTYYLNKNVPVLSKILLSKNFSRIVKYMPIFGYLHGKYPNEYLKTFYTDFDFFSKNNSSNYYNLNQEINKKEEKAVGFKIMLSQVKQIPTLLNWINNERDLKIIYLMTIG